MSLFDPSTGALPNASSVAYLAQRDVQLNTPVNFCTYPGVALTPACFANKAYDDKAASTCISNLLVMGFRRVSVDLFWDASQLIWSLCPVELPKDLTGILATSVSVAASDATATSLGQTSILGARDTLPTGSSEQVVERQAGVGNTQTDTSTSTTSSSASVTASPSPSVSPTFNGSLVQLGPYTCSPTLRIYEFVELLSQYLYSTETNLNATTLVLTLNIHAASPASDPAGSAQQPSDENLPRNNSTLKSIFQALTPVYLFTPAYLAAGRANLNGTEGWYSSSVTRQNEPSPAYFQIEENDGQYSTPDGWPSESYIELTRAKRMLIQFGTVDPQMAGYDFSADESTIFPAGYLDAPRAVTAASDGSIATGCFFDAGTTAVQNVNSSWATYVLGSGGDTAATDLPALLNLTANLTACGISPLLNATLDSATADTTYEPYQHFVRQSIWSWGPGQPLNSSASPSTLLYQCAALNASSRYWEAANCDSPHYAACHNSTQPYVWTISSSTQTYLDVDGHCPSNTAFDVPRNALENAYLLAAWQDFLAAKASDSSGDDDDDDAHDPLLWLNFNDLDVNACWVIGQNSTCPYQDPTASVTRRVVVSTVSGVIVFVLAALLVLVKCAGNHQSSKRKRRRGADGWDYEGVPS